MATTRYKLDIIRTSYRHWSAYGGYPQYLRHLTEPVKIKTRAVSDHYPLALNREFTRRRLAGVLRNAPCAWYQMNDWLTEAGYALRAWGTNCWPGRIPRVLHYLDAEHGLGYLPRVRRKGLAPLGNTKFVASFHQPPEQLRKIMNKPGLLGELDALLVVGRNQIPYFEQFITPEKIYFVPHGVRADFFQPGPNTTPNARFGRSQGSERGKAGAPRLLTVGYWLRDFQLIQKTVEYYQGRDDSPHFVIISHHPDLKNFHYPNAEVVSGLSDQELLAEYQRADALFLPLYDATANNSLLEGMACALPVITTRVGAVTDYITEEGALFVDPGSPRTAIQAIDSLVNDPSKGSRLGAANRLRATTELTFENMARQMEGIYRGLLSAP